jgi:hypothetical protein
MTYGSMWDLNFEAIDLNQILKKTNEKPSQMLSTRVKIKYIEELHLRSLACI